MATPRKRRQPAELGPRVGASSKGGRPARGLADVVGVATRVRAIKDRLNAIASGHTRRIYTWRGFAERIGISEETLATRLRPSSPTPFTVTEVMALCREFRVRSEYLLFGRGPMFGSEVVGAEINDRTLALALHAHVVSIAQAKTEQERRWVKAFVPPPPDLLIAIEHAIQDSIERGLELTVHDRKLVVESVRQAVAAAVRACSRSPNIHDGVFKTAADVRDGLVVCPPRGADGTG